MRRTSLVVLFSLASAVCAAESLTGRLIDATCHIQAQSKAALCAPTPKTTSFGLELSSGKVYNLDMAGNVKATELIKTDSKTDQMVVVSGTASGDTFRVESIKPQPQQ